MTEPLAKKIKTHILLLLRISIEFGQYQLREEASPAIDIPQNDFSRRKIQTCRH